MKHIFHGVDTHLSWFLPFLILTSPIPACGASVSQPCVFNAPYASPVSSPDYLCSTLCVHRSLRSLMIPWLVTLPCVFGCLDPCLLPACYCCLYRTDCLCMTTWLSCKDTTFLDFKLTTCEFLCLRVSVSTTGDVKYYACGSGRN